MSDQDIPDNVVEFRRKPKGENSSAKRARTVAHDPDIEINNTVNLKPGDNVVCRIIKYVPGGFNVVLVPQTLPAYLPSNSNHQPGDELCVIFVKEETDRLLLSQRVAEKQNKSTTHQPFPNPGAQLNCTIVKAEEGGYEVFVAKYNWPGYLPSNAQHQPGDEILSTFVCVDNQRMLLAERFTHGQGDLVKRFPTAPDDDDEQ